jgi:hypothetical protein
MEWAGRGSRSPPVPVTVLADLEARAGPLGLPVDAVGGGGSDRGRDGDRLVGAGDRDPASVRGALEVQAPPAAHLGDDLVLRGTGRSTPGEDGASAAKPEVRRARPGGRFGLGDVEACAVELGAGQAALADLDLDPAPAADAGVGRPKAPLAGRLGGGGDSPVGIAAGLDEAQGLAGDPAGLPGQEVAAASVARSGSASLAWIVLLSAVLGWLLGLVSASVVRWRTRAPRRPSTS